MAIWKDILRVASPIAGTFIGGPIGAALTGGIVSKILPPDERDQFEDWAKYAQGLEDDDELTNVERHDRLEARIRMDLYEETGEEPPTRRVAWLVETVVMSINGEFEPEDGEAG